MILKEEDKKRFIEKCQELASVHPEMDDFRKLGKLQALS